MTVRESDLCAIEMILLASTTVICLAKYIGYCL